MRDARPLAPGAAPIALRSPSTGPDDGRLRIVPFRREVDAVALLLEFAVTMKPFSLLSVGEVVDAAIAAAARGEVAAVFEGTVPRAVACWSAAASGETGPPGLRLLMVAATVPGTLRLLRDHLAGLHPGSRVTGTRDRQRERGAMLRRRCPSGS